MSVAFEHSGTSLHLIVDLSAVESLSNQDGGTVHVGSMHGEINETLTKEGYTIDLSVRRALTPSEREQYGADLQLDAAPTAKRGGGGRSKSPQPQK